LKPELQTFAVAAEGIANRLSGEFWITSIALTCPLRFVFDFEEDSE